MNKTNQPTQMSDLDGTMGPTGTAQQQTHTNPFSADLQGEFSSNFGTNTNAVSQIFREGSFNNGNGKKLLIMGGVLMVLVAIAAFMLTREEEDPFADLAPQASVPSVPVESVPAVTDPTAPAEATAAEAASAQDSAAVPVNDTPATAATNPGAVAETGTASSDAVGSMMLDAPVNGDVRAYDETAGPALFSWQGNASHILFSRSQTMQPVYMKAPVSGNSYEFYHPYPGAWYWQLQGPDGVSEIRTFRVEPAAMRNVVLQQPAEGGTVAGSAGVISWAGDTKVAFYRVEFSNSGSFAKPTYTFATSGTSLQTQGVAPGGYQLRVGAFSEVSGKWEYTRPISVTVQ